MKENKSSKQLMLSMVGIAILLITVVGVSFAFFSYSRVGTSNNVISTGEIFMNFTEQNGINLTNQFPMLASEAEATNGIVTGSVSDVAYLNFSVVGYYSSTTGGIDYTVYLVNGDAPSGKTANDRLDDSEINVFLTSNSAATTTRISNGTITNNIASSAAVSSLTGSLSTGKAIVTGRIAANTSSSSQQTDAFTLAMYVNDTVRISDTDTAVTWTGASGNVDSISGRSATKYCASDRTKKTVDQTKVYDYGCRLYKNNNVVTALAENADDTGIEFLKTYSDMYYSLKLKVVGTEVVNP